MSAQTYQKEYKLYYLLVLAAVLLLLPAVYNHFPLIDPDAGTYIASGFKPETPFDRPITYGLLIRLFSLNGWSLWLVVFAQALIVVSLIFAIMRAVNPVGYILNGFVVILFLSLFTTLPWMVSMLQPDIFTAIACMCIVLLFLPRRSKLGRVCIYTLFFISIAVHMSHPLLFTGLLVCLFLMKRLYTEPVLRPWLQTTFILLVFLSMAGITIMGSALSKSKHVFFVGSLLEKGVLQTYMNDNCGTKNYKICAYKDFLPKSSDEFIWVTSSPLYKIGDWQGTKIEFNDIIHNVLTTPKYVLLFIKATCIQFGQQAITFDVGRGNLSFPISSNVNNQFVAYLPSQVASFNNAVQNHASLPQRLHLINIINSAVVAISIVVLMAFIAFRWATASRALRTLLVVTIAGCIINCADIAAFSVVVGRYEAKMIWLLPFCALVCIINQSRPKTA